MKNKHFLVRDRCYRREYYQRNREKLRAQQNEYARIKRGDPPADKSVKPIFLLLALLKWHHDHCAWRRAYRAKNREKLITQEKDRFLKNADRERARKAAYARKWRSFQPKPIKPPAKCLSQAEKLERNRREMAAYREANRERVNANKRASSKRKLRDAAANPEALEAIRAKRRNAHRKWIDKVKAQYPDQYSKLINRRNARMRGWVKQRRALSPAFKIAQTLRTRINDALRGKTKSGSLSDLTGCSLEQLLTHLAGGFSEGMFWSNHGKGYGKWTIDHIIPCASFDLNDPEEQKKCFHYSNLRPMWFEKNCAKNSIYEGHKCYHKPTSPCPPNPSPLR